MDASAADVAVVVAVVVLRLVVPLLIPMFPLPAIVVALVVDGVDQTIFQTQLSPSFWAQVENSYQGYDKALDVYYLSIAYVATMRNWTNRSAALWAQFLWIFRLSGVTLFEVVHDPGEPASWRWLLLVFPNTFEYFFIAYETVRLRWDPRRLSPVAVTALVAAIWVFVKLPQEWWIHVARLDFTDVAAAHRWVMPTLTAVLVVAAGVAWWAIRYRLPGADQPFGLRAGPLPEELDTAAERAAYRAEHWRVLDTNLLQKTVLIGLLCVDFAQILPGNTGTPRQVTLTVAVLVLVTSAVSLALARRARSAENLLAGFAAVAAVNLAVVWVARLLSERFDPDHATFFVLLIALVTVLYDRYRPVRDVRLRAAARASATTQGA